MKHRFIALVIVFMIALPIRGGYEKGRFKAEMGDEIFDRLVLKIMQIAKIPSISMAIVKEDKLIWTKGFGEYDLENCKEANEDAIYLVASISKTITATAIMQLHEKGYLSLDEDVNKYLPFVLRNPKYPNKQITFRMLLAHQSSLAVDPPAFYSYFPADLEVKDYLGKWLKEYLTPDGIHYKPQIWTDKEPGKEMNYANVGYSILGYLVERIANMDFEEYCRQNIFMPLGMENSSFDVINLNISRLAVPYIFQNGKYYPLLHYAILDYPAGGLRTSIVDLSHFLIAHMNGGIYNGIRILSEESVKEMHSVQYPNNKYSFQYGLGWQIWYRGGEKYVGHTGSLYGILTEMKYRESDKTGIIFFMNKGADSIRDVVAFSLIESLLFWKASNFDFNEIKITRIKERVIENMHILNEQYSYDVIDYNLKEMLKALQFFPFLQY